MLFLLVIDDRIIRASLHVDGACLRNSVNILWCSQFSLSLSLSLSRFWRALTPLHQP